LHCILQSYSQVILTETIYKYEIQHNKTFITAKE